MHYPFFRLSSLLFLHLRPQGYQEFVDVPAPHPSLRAKYIPAVMINMQGCAVSDPEVGGGGEDRRRSVLGVRERGGERGIGKLSACARYYCLHCNQCHHFGYIC